MKHMKICLVMCLCFLLCLSLSGCGSSKSGESKTDGGKETTKKSGENAVSESEDVLAPILGDWYNAEEETRLNFSARMKCTGYYLDDDEVMMTATYTYDGTRGKIVSDGETVNIKLSGKVLELTNGDETMLFIREKPEIKATEPETEPETKPETKPAGNSANAAGIIGRWFYGGDSTLGYIDIFNDGTLDLVYGEDMVSGTYTWDGYYLDIIMEDGEEDSLYLDVDGTLTALDDTIYFVHDSRISSGDNDDDSELEQWTWYSWYYHDNSWVLDFYSDYTWMMCDSDGNVTDEGTFELVEGELLMYDLNGTYVESAHLDADMVTLYLSTWSDYFYAVE